MMYTRFSMLVDDMHSSKATFPIIQVPHQAGYLYRCRENFQLDVVLPKIANTPIVTGTVEKVLQRYNESTIILCFITGWTVKVNDSTIMTYELNLIKDPISDWDRAMSVL